MKKGIIFALALLTAVFSLNGMFVSKAHAAFNANRIIDDVIFDNSTSMDGNAINSWLNTFFPNSCISPNSGFEARIPAGYTPSGGFTYGDFVPAGNVISQAALIYGINPQVLLATLQKEQSLVAGGVGYCENGDYHKYAAATGYGCPDGGTVYNWSGVSLYRRYGVERTTTGSTCVNSAAKAGFSQQVIRAAWLLKFGEQRSKGNIGWAIVNGSWDNSDDPQTCYGGPMTQGNFQVCPSGPTTFYDGWRTIDSTAVHMDTGATAALYWYTPHFHGNQNFVSLYESWFGSTLSDQCITNNTDLPITGVTFRKKNYPRLDQGDFVIYTGSGSHCVESHTWNVGVTSWASHVATNIPTTPPDQGQIQYADLNGDGVDEPIWVSLNNTGSGKIEFHVWNSDMKTWKDHIISPANQGLTPTMGKLVFADVDGDGRDEPVVILYTGTGSGKIEFHVMNNDLRTWRWHVVSNISNLDPSIGTIVFGDVDGDHIDEPVLVLYKNTGSGVVEFHTWNPGWFSWRFHTASNLAAINPADGFITFADVDGNGVDEAVLVGMYHTGSGKIEFHTWNLGVTSWRYHTASNQPTI